MKLEIEKSSFPRYVHAEQFHSWKNFSQFAFPGRGKGFFFLCVLLSSFFFSLMHNKYFTCEQPDQRAQAPNQTHLEGERCDPFPFIIKSPAAPNARQKSSRNLETTQEEWLCAPRGKRQNFDYWLQEIFRPLRALLVVCGEQKTHGGHTVHWRAKRCDVKSDKVEIEWAAERASEYQTRWTALSEDVEFK